LALAAGRSPVTSRRAFRIAYDGRPFHGFQDAVFDALRDLGVLGDADAPSGYAAAGRTDAGVSALAQTVAFDAPDWLTPRALNADLPGTVRAWASADAPPTFHATHDAASRTYVYHLHAPALDDARARAALDDLAGEHDFHNLTTDETGTVRTLSVAAEHAGDCLEIRVEAGGFARGLVRRLVSLVRAVAAGERDPAFVDRVLAPDPLDGPEGVPPAPATPLVLSGVRYPDLRFEADPVAAESARAALGERRVEALSAARALGAVRDGLGGETDPAGGDGGAAED
jgi:tRNA pseudouridine38-40 synthase